MYRVLPRAAPVAVEVHDVIGRQLTLEGRRRGVQRASTKKSGSADSCIGYGGARSTEDYHPGMLGGSADVPAMNGCADALGAVLFIQSMSLRFIGPHAGRYGGKPDRRGVFAVTGEVGLFGLSGAGTGGCSA